MPRISEFYGIVVAMYFNDHEPPHVHVVYGGHRALVSIDPIRVLPGSLPRRAESLMVEWVGLHQEELRENWRRAREHRPLMPIEPLE